jgi:hypothetical protein
MMPQIVDEFCIINNTNTTTTKNRFSVLYYNIILNSAPKFLELSIINNTLFHGGISW